MNNDGIIFWALIFSFVWWLVRKNKKIPKDTDANPVTDNNKKGLIASFFATPAHVYNSIDAFINEREIRRLEREIWDNEHTIALLVDELRLSDQSLNDGAWKPDIDRIEREREKPNKQGVKIPGTSEECQEIIRSLNVSIGVQNTIIALLKKKIVTLNGKQEATDKETTLKREISTIKEQHTRETEELIQELERQHAKDFEDITKEINELQKLTINLQNLVMERDKEIKILQAKLIEAGTRTLKNNNADIAKQLHDKVYGNKPQD